MLVLSHHKQQTKTECWCKGHGQGYSWARCFSSDFGHRWEAGPSVPPTYHWLEGEHSPWELSTQASATAESPCECWEKELRQKRTPEVLSLAFVLSKMFSIQEALIKVNSTIVTRTFIIHFQLQMSADFWAVRQLRWRKHSSYILFPSSNSPPTEAQT